MLNWAGVYVFFPIFISFESSNAKAMSIFVLFLMSKITHRSNKLIKLFLGVHACVCVFKGANEQNEKILEDIKFQNRFFVCVKENRTSYQWSRNEQKKSSTICHSSDRRHYNGPYRETGIATTHVTATSQNTLGRTVRIYHRAKLVFRTV